MQLNSFDTLCKSPEGPESLDLFSLTQIRGRPAPVQAPLVEWAMTHRHHRAPCCRCQLAMGKSQLLGTDDSWGV